MDIDAILKDLRGDYLAVLPETIEKISALYDQNNLPLIREEFHKLKGSGKVYGMDEITILSQAVEHICHFNSVAADPLIPKAIHLLNKIYEAHIEGKNFSLEEDPVFQPFREWVHNH